MTATVYSKSVLRAVCGDLQFRNDDVDYFPSYEIISNPWNKDCLYEDDLRSIRKIGVDKVMDAFFAEHGASDEQPAAQHAPAASVSDWRQWDDTVCEEAILEAFGNG